MPTETATFDLVVNAGLASKTLEETRAKALGLGGGLGAIEEKLDAIGGKAGRDASNAIRSLQFALGGAAGPGAEVVNFLGDMSDVLTGGVVTAGLLALGVGVGKVKEALDEAAANGRVFNEAMRAMGTALDTVNRDHLEATKQTLKDIEESFRFIGKTATEKTLIVVQSELEQDILNLPKVQEAARKARAKFEELRVDDIQRRITEREIMRRATEDFESEEFRLKSMMDELERRARAIDERIKGNVQNADKAGSLVDVERAPKAKERREAHEQEVEATIRAEIALHEKFDQQEVRQEEEKRKYLEMGLDDVIAAKEAEVAVYKRFGDRIAQQDKQAADAKKQLLDKQTEEIKAASAEAIGIGVSATQQLVDALITGQDHALEHFVANVFKQAGTAMIGHGIDAASGGIAQLALSGGAVGGEALAVGVGLIAGGGLIGGISTGIEHSLAGGSAAGSLPGPAATDLGVGGSLPGSRGSDGGPQQITVVFEYGLGPAPEKMARDLAAAIDYGVQHRIIDSGRPGSARRR